MGALSDILDSLRLQAAVFAQTELVAPWGIAAPGRSHLAFHIVLRGSGWLEVDPHEPAQVGAGDVILVAPGLDHTLRDSLETHARPLDELIATGMIGRRISPSDRTGARTQLVCGRFSFGHPRAQVIVSALPPVIHLGEMSHVGPWLEQTLRLVRQESTEHRPGGDVLINRLCEALFVYAVRAVIAGQADGDPNWLRGLSDPQIGAAMQVIHEEPARRWTLEELARRASMSRSAFAAKFVELVGDTPMRYLTGWRLQKAAGQLRETNGSIAEIAAQVGYDSEAAFNKAFKRYLGVPPGAFRRGADPVAIV